MSRLVFAARLQPSEDVEQHDLAYQSITDAWVDQVAKSPLGFFNGRRRKPFPLQRQPFVRDDSEGIRLGVPVDQAASLVALLLRTGE